MGIEGVLGVCGEQGAATEWSRNSWEVRNQEPSISMVVADDSQRDPG